MLRIYGLNRPKSLFLNPQFAQSPFAQKGGELFARIHNGEDPGSDWDWISPPRFQGRSGFNAVDNRDLTSEHWDNFT